MLDYSHCYYHEDRSPVAQCPRCKKFLCKECASQLAPNQNGVTLCPDCQKVLEQERKKENETKVNELEKEKGIVTFKFFLCVIGIGVGLVLFFTGNEIAGVLIWGLGGIPSAWKFLEGAFSDPVSDAVYATHSGDGGLISLLIRLVLAIIVAIVAAPILFIVNAVKIVKISDEINKLNGD
jgi:hypothetical protein